MQEKKYKIEKQTFRCDVPGEIGRDVDTNTVVLFYRPYYTDEQKPKKHKFHAASVKHKATYWGEDVHILNCEIDGRGCAEGLKISFGYNITVEDCIIHGGYEDCVDIVRGANITFKNCKFISYNTKQHMTIKGGCKNITIDNCEFVNDFSKWYDGAIIDIGNYSIYDQVKRPKVRHVTIKNCRLTNIKTKILSRVLYGNKPTVQNTKGFIFKIPSFITSIFFKLRNSGKLGKVSSLELNDKLVYDIEKI